jgi:CheY-like chemotaxis protein
MTWKATSERAPVPRPAPTSRALVVDDDDTYRTLIRAVLEPLGWEVDDAWNGQVGWQMFQLARYDLVVIDIFMPQQEGLETIRCMRARAPGVPILAISGGGIMGSDGYLEAAQRMGATLSLAKPFRPAALLEAMRSLGIAWTQERAPTAAGGQ